MVSLLSPVAAAIARKVVGDDLELLDLLDQAVRNPHGGDRRSDDAIKVDNVNVGPTGNAKDQALRRVCTPNRRTDGCSNILLRSVALFAV